MRYIHKGFALIYNLFSILIGYIFALLFLGYAIDYFQIINGTYQEHDLLNMPYFFALTISLIIALLIKAFRIK